jgi:hypothetical protein
VLLALGLNADEGRQVRVVGEGSEEEEERRREQAPADCRRRDRPPASPVKTSRIERHRDEPRDESQEERRDDHTIPAALTTAGLR